jgi:hypothetical protein
MFDAVNPLNIPLSAAVVGGYANGKYVWSAADWARFPKAVKLRYDVTGGAPLDSDILDVEPGNLGTPIITSGMPPAAVEAVWADLCNRARTWVSVRHAHSIGSTCYIQESRKNQLAQTLKGLPVVFLMAQWGITQAHAETLVTGAEIGVQFQSTAAYDVSVVDDKWYPEHDSAAPEPAAPAVKSVTVTVGYSDGSEKTEKF